MTEKLRTLARVEAAGDGFGDRPEKEEGDGGNGAGDAARGEAEDGLEGEEKANELADDRRDGWGRLTGEPLVDLVTGIDGVGADEVEPDIGVAQWLGAIDGGDEEGHDD